MRAHLWRRWVGARLRVWADNVDPGQTRARAAADNNNADNKDNDVRANDESELIRGLNVKDAPEHWARLVRNSALQGGTEPITGRTRRAMGPLRRAASAESAELSAQQPGGLAPSHQDPQQPPQVSASEQASAHIPPAPEQTAIDPAQGPSTVAKPPPARSFSPPSSGPAEHPTARRGHRLMPRTSTERPIRSTVPPGSPLSARDDPPDDSRPAPRSQEAPSAIAGRTAAARVPRISIRRDIRAGTGPRRLEELHLDHAADADQPGTVWPVATTAANRPSRPADGTGEGIRAAPPALAPSDTTERVAAVRTSSPAAPPDAIVTQPHPRQADPGTSPAQSGRWPELPIRATERIPASHAAVTRILARVDRLIREQAAV